MKKLILGFVGCAIVATLAMGAGNVVPPSSGGADLGTTTLPWKAIYVTTANISNQVVNGTFTADEIDSTTATALLIGKATATSLTLGASDIITTVAGAFISSLDASVLGGDITGANTNSIDIGEVADGTITFKRATAGAVTLVGADDTGAGDITIDATLGGAVIIGSADVTSITLTTDSTGTGEVVLPAQCVAGAEMVNDTVTKTQVAYGMFGASADLMVQYGTATNAQAITFNPVYGSGIVPVMNCTWAGVTTHKLYIQTVASNTATIGNQDGSETNLIHWMAIGVAP